MCIIHNIFYKIRMYSPVKILYHYINHHYAGSLTLRIIANKLDLYKKMYHLKFSLNHLNIGMK